MKLVAQNEQILKHLKRGYRVTPIQALQKWGCLRLSGRIYDLRAQGHKIRTEIVERHGKRFAEYRLEAA